MFEAFRTGGMWLGASVMVMAVSGLALAQTRPASLGEQAILDMPMPSARLYLTADSADRAANVPIPMLAPGEDRDLGTIMLQQEQP